MSYARAPSQLWKFRAGRSLVGSDVGRHLDRTGGEGGDMSQGAGPKPALWASNGGMATELAHPAGSGGRAVIKWAGQILLG